MRDVCNRGMIVDPPYGPRNKWVECMSGIVIIEDDVLMAALLEDYLTGAGYPTRAGALRETPATDKADLVIIDVYMPRHAGTELIRAAKAMHPGTPLIAISGQFCSSLAACGATAHSLGVRQVVAKPFTRDELLRAVRAVIGPPR